MDTTYLSWIALIRAIFSTNILPFSQAAISTLCSAKLSHLVAPRNMCWNYWRYGKFDITSSSLTAFSDRPLIHKIYTHCKHVLRIMCTSQSLTLRYSVLEAVTLDFHAFIYPQIHQFCKIILNTFKLASYALRPFPTLQLLRRDLATPQIMRRDLFTLQIMRWDNFTTQSHDEIPGLATVSKLSWFTYQYANQVCDFRIDKFWHSLCRNTTTPGNIASNFDHLIWKSGLKF